jgi:hypothetical protein
MTYQEAFAHLQMLVRTLPGRVRAGNAILPLTNGLRIHIPTLKSEIGDSSRGYSVIKGRIRVPYAHRRVGESNRTVVRNLEANV